MKRAFTLFGYVTCLICMAVGAATAVYAACPSDMVAYWKMDELDGPSYADQVDVADAACAGACPEATGGVVNRAQRFDGISSGLSVTRTDAFNWSGEESFTIEFWFRRAQPISGDEVIIGRVDADTALLWSVGLTAGGTIQFQVTDAGGTSRTLEGTRNVADGAWHHVVALYRVTDGTLTLFADTRTEATESGISFDAGFASDTAALTIGWLDLSPVPYFGGVADEIAIYRRALSTNEVFTHFYNGLADFRWGYCDDPRQIRIMPLGDAITAGMVFVDDGSGNMVQADSATWTGYRQRLNLSLLLLGYNTDFTGTQTYGRSATPAFDFNNEGHPGFSSQLIGLNIFNWLTANPSDIVLLHIGTETDAPSVSQVEQVLEEIDRYSRDVTVVLARIINRGTPVTDISTFNDAIQEMADRRGEAGDKIVVVDMENALTYPDDMSDNLRPNASGYTKMADTWFNTLIAVPNLPDVAPQITSEPVRGATAASPYSYEVFAVGSPSPRFMLNAAPDGMTIDADTGVIEWTPFVEGSYPVTVQAENALGQDTQTFTVTVLPRQNQAPAADAGEDLVTFEGATVTLDGSASVDPDGGIESYQWTQLSGTPVVLSPADAVRPTFAAPAVAASSLVFRLTVTDAGGLSDADEVQVIVNAALPPIADAGADQSVTTGDTVTLDGSASRAQSAGIVSVLWEQVDGPQVTLSNPGAVQPSFVAPNVQQEGAVLTFRLTVTDGLGQTAESTVQVTVAYEKKAPTANAGTDQIVLEGATVVLNGAGSTDPDGGISTFAWRQIQGTTVPLSAEDKSIATFVAPPVGPEALDFELTVTDKDGLTDTDQVRITVNDNGIQNFPEDVISLTTVTLKPIGVRLSNVGELVQLFTIDPASISDTTGRPGSMIYGLIRMVINVPNPGDSALVTILLPEPAPAGYSWYQYSAAEGWRRMDIQNAFNADRTEMTLTLTDGGPGDGDNTAVANGTIDHMSGLGYIAPPDEESSSNLFSCFIQTSATEPNFSIHKAGYFLIIAGIFFLCGLLFRLRNSKH